MPESDSRAYRKNTNHAKNGQWAIQNALSKSFEPGATPSPRIPLVFLQCSFELGIPCSEYLVFLLELRRIGKGTVNVGFPICLNERYVVDEPVQILVGKVNLGSLAINHKNSRSMLRSGESQCTLH